MSAYYYDLTDTHCLSSDDEGDLVMLCEHCAADYAEVVQFAQAGDAECVCELCGELEDLDA